MRLRKIVLLWALAVPVGAWSQTVPTVASGGNLHYVGAGVTTWGNGDIGAQINVAYAALPPRGGTIVVIAPANGACYSFSTPIVAAVPGKYLLLQGGRTRIANLAAIGSGLPEFYADKFFSRDHVGLCPFGRSCKHRNAWDRKSDVDQQSMRDDWGL
jgi:hypothetical protein